MKLHREYRNMGGGGVIPVIEENKKNLINLCMQPFLNLSHSLIISNREEVRVDMDGCADLIPCCFERLSLTIRLMTLNY